MLDIFPKINMSECQVQEAKCWLPSYCIRIKILALQLCVKRSKTSEKRGTIEPFYGVECQNHLLKESILRSLYDWLTTLGSIPAPSYLEFLDLLNLNY